MQNTLTGSVPTSCRESTSNSGRISWRLILRTSRSALWQARERAAKAAHEAYQKNSNEQSASPAFLFESGRSLRARPGLKAHPLLQLFSERVQAHHRQSGLTMRRITALVVIRLGLSVFTKCKRAGRQRIVEGLSAV